MNVYWYSLPLCAAISLVYAASRHESWRVILRQAGRIFLTMLGLLAISTVILLLINTQT